MVNCSLCYTPGLGRGGKTCYDCTSSGLIAVDHCLIPQLIAVLGPYPGTVRETVISDDCSLGGERRST